MKTGAVSEAAPSEKIHFFQRPFPSANMTLIAGRKPVLVDSGFGSDLARTMALIRDSGTEPGEISLVVNTHAHSDHAGGNFGLQTQFHLPIAAHVWEAAMVNRRDPEACGAIWLDQPVEPYHVDRLLEDGDEFESGDVRFRVLHTPGHTLGHISLYSEELKILICGDATHEDDVGWINIFREGGGALERAIQSAEKLRKLPVKWACSGHGPAMTDPQAAFERALKRYESWVDKPEKIAWHACKRIFAYRLILVGGINEPDLAPYLLACRWFQDFCRDFFKIAPPDFIRPFLEEMLRSGAAKWEGPRLVAGVEHHPAGSWNPAAPIRPAEWPKTAGSSAEAKP